MEFIYADNVFTGSETLEKMYIGITDGIITYMDKKMPEEYGKFYDYSGYCIFPALIDIHTHGAIGIDTNSALAEDFIRLAEYNKKCNLAAFMPTAVTDSYENIEKILDEVKRAMDIQKNCKNKGAEILGLFLEGVFINPLKKGSHIEKYIREIDIEFIKHISDKYKGVLKRMIIAPELANAQKAIELLTENGVKVCIGHSCADYGQSLSAINAGADSAVHIFNAMGRFEHRKGGILSASLLEDIYGEIICDFVHTDSNAVRLLLRCKEHNKIILVTDNVCAKGTKGERCRLGETEVFIKDGSAVISDGTLAGGNSDIIDGIRNMISIGVSKEEAFKMGSLNAAEYLGIQDKFGKIQIGRRAEFWIEKIS